MKKTTNSKIFSNYVLVIISITVVLFFLSSFLITILNSEKIINDFKEKIPVVVFLKENISTIELTQFEKKLKIDVDWEILAEIDYIPINIAERQRRQDGSYECKRRLRPIFYGGAAS